MANKLLEVKHLKQYFGKSSAPVKAVDDISFDVYEGDFMKSRMEEEFLTVRRSLIIYLSLIRKPMPRTCK